MGMFDALLPQDNYEFGNESFEEIVDNYCAALEDVESEIAGLESLGEAIDNAEAFAAAIESCGGEATPALMQFGYSVDPSFGQLIGRECPSDFATEDMHEFGSFAIESIRSKLTVAWEAVKAFIVRIWEKLKEFGRWVLSLFDRKEAKLRAIAKAAKDKQVKNKPFAGKEGNAEKRHVRCYKWSKIENLLGRYDLFNKAKETVTRLENGLQQELDADQTAKFISDTIGTMAKDVFAANSKTGAVLLSNEMKNEFKEYTLKDAGFTSWKDIEGAANRCIEALGNKRGLDAAIKDFGKFLSTIDKDKREAEARARDIEGSKADKLDREERASKDYAKADKIARTRKLSVAASKVVVLSGKVINNCCASVIAVANCAGL